MDQRKLYRTIEKITNQNYESEDELVKKVLEEVVNNKLLDVTGGRIWKLTPSKKKYKLLFQIGDIEPIRPNFTLSVEHYPIFELLSRQRTVLASETNLYLLSRGITKYSATGIGEKLKGDKFRVYQYMMALSSQKQDQDLFYTLNIISTAITATLRNKRLEKESKQLSQDIDQAREIQKRILPDHEITFAGYEIFGVSLPERIVGGDFFDYLQIGDDKDKLGIAVADVASKGFSAAAEALYVSGALRMGVTYHTNISPLMKKLNNLVYQVFPDDRFVSLVYFELSNNANGFTVYCNAGHNSPMLYKKKSEEILLLDSTGPLIGPAYNSKFSTDAFNFEIDDVLVIYTDGITEAMNQDGELYEESRLQNKILSLTHLSAKEITMMILEDVQKFSTDGKYSDDKTIVTIKRVN